MCVNNLPKVATQWDSGATRESSRGHRVRIPRRKTDITDNTCTCMYVERKPGKRECLRWERSDFSCSDERLELLRPTTAVPWRRTDDNCDIEDSSSNAYSAQQIYNNFISMAQYYDNFTNFLYFNEIMFSFRYTSVVFNQNQTLLLQIIILNAVMKYRQCNTPFSNDDKTLIKNLYQFKEHDSRNFRRWTATGKGWTLY